jgi:hypothetical protein
MCNQCEENEQITTGGLTDQQTAAKQYALPSSKGGIKKSMIIFCAYRFHCDAKTFSTKIITLMHHQPRQKS